MTVAEHGVGCDGKGLTQVSAPGPGIECLLGGGVQDAPQQLFFARDLQCRAEPACKHRGLIETPLTQAPIGKRYWHQCVGWLQSFIEVMLQGLRQQFAHQPTERPFGLMFEACDQAVDRKVVGPWRQDPLEGWRLSGALATTQPGHGQWQGADTALVTEPGQFALAGGANGLGVSVVSPHNRQDCLFFNQM